MDDPESRDISLNQSRGCSVQVGNSICGETNSLDIMKEFNRLYEDWMQQVDSEAGGDCLQEKLKLQQEWIQNLTQQNEMLVRAVQELEYEATERVKQLEEKLHKSAQCLCEVMKKYREFDFTADLLTEPLQTISNLEDDIRNVLEFIRRIRENGHWNTEGLFFHKITNFDLLGNKDKCVNKKIIDNLSEGQKLLNEKERIVNELTEKVNYYCSFGDIEHMSKELKCRREECESLKEAMGDVRQVLTEEVASKHDEIIALKKEIQVLEERCSQADKQIIFKDDINKELRKEIKQLKPQFTQDEISKLTATIENLHSNLEQTKIAQDQEERMHQNELTQLNNTIYSLEQELRVVQEKMDLESKICKICRGKAKVGFLDNAQVQANLDSKESELSKELNEFKSKMGLEVDRRENEIHSLRCKVNELELALNSCEERATNLQEAVTLYSNSINILETAEKQANVQIQQQKMTIANLQEGLIEAKHELDDMHKRNQDNDIKGKHVINALTDELEDTEIENDFIKSQFEHLSGQHEDLQDLNFNLEVDHCASLQDVEILENQLYKYMHLLKGKEAESNQCKDQLKKLSKQKRCYEEIITYFKHEMGLMAEQLNNLQELLTLSNESAQEESSKIMQAFMEVQNLNEKLSSQLCACEQKVQLENQMNQLHETKICELQRLINEKEIDLTKHDQAIVNIRRTLNDSMKQNEELQRTIVELNETISDLQGAVKQYEQENCDSRRSTLEFQEQIGHYCYKLEELKGSLEEKTTECLKLEMAYNNEKRALKVAQKQLHETERLQQENQRELVSSLDDLRIKLEASNESNSRLCRECETLQNQLANLTRKEAVKDLEIKRYRKIVGDLKNTMMELNSELNKNLAQKELKSVCKNVNCRRDFAKEDSKNQEICLNCPCEIEFYQKMVDVLKKSVIELKQQLTQTQEKNRVLENEVKLKDSQIYDLQATKVELDQKSHQSHLSDLKIAELEAEIERLRQELEVRSMQLNEVKKTAQEINGSKCVQLVCAQEEISNLKAEITNILNSQYNLKRENEELQNQTAQLRCTINCINEQDKMLKDQMDQYVSRMKTLNSEKETLVRKNKELLNELKCLQSMTFSMDKQQRLTTDSLRQLEWDVEDLKLNKEEICSESRNVIKNVRAWVEEQKLINSLIAKREQMFFETIKKMNYDKECPYKRTTLSRISAANRTMDYHRSNTMCASPCSLGSQGTASFYDGESPPASPDIVGTNDWFSSTFKAESEGDSEEDYCVNTLENLTQQMKNSNKMWINERRNCTDCRVTKDAKDKK